MVTPDYKFILIEEKTNKEYDITDLVETICNTIQEEIEERLGGNY